MYDEILYALDDTVATITLNRPDRLNAWTPRMAAEVRHAIEQAEGDPAVVTIVLTGAGRGFCSGADLDLLRSIGEGKARIEENTSLPSDPGDPAAGESFRKTYSYLMSVRKPIIAAINGPCAGLALPIALYCDLRFASDRASFLVAFPRRGLIAEWGIGWILPRVVGLSNAMDLLLSGRKIDAAEALRIGLVNRVVPDGELLKHVYEYARELATHSSPTSMQVIKRQVYQGTSESLGEAFDRSVQLMGESFGRADFREGVRSFMERRPPRFERVRKDSRTKEEQSP